MSQNLSSRGCRSLLRQLPLLLKDLTDSAQSLADGDFSARLPNVAQPEFEPVFMAFNQMATTMQRSIERLEGEKRFMQTMIDAIPDLIFFKDKEGVYLGCNEAFALRFVGRPKTQIVSHTDFDFIPDQDQAEFFRQKDLEAMAAKAVRTNDEMITLANGRSALVETVKVPYCDQQGKIAGLIGVARDITARKHAEEAIAFKSMLLETQSETSPDGILNVDNEGNAILFNRRFGEMWKIPQDVLDTRDDQKMLGFVLEQLKHPKEFLDKVAWLYEHHDENSRDEVELVDGRFFDRFSSPLISTDNKAMGRIWFFRDITDQKQADEALQEKTVLLEEEVTERQQAQEALEAQTAILEEEISERQQAQDMLAGKQLELESLNRLLQERIDGAVAELRQKDQVLINQGRQAAMGEMIGNIAHQWRQPLNALSMLVGNLQFAQLENELTAEYLNEAAATANRLIQKMSTTINDFRNFFSPDKEKVLFSARQQIQHAVDLVETAYRNSNIFIEINAETDCTLNGFPNEYSQVLLNLLSNAKEAIQESASLPGRITVILSEQEGMGVVTVRDNGGGIPDTVQDKIFEPYFSTKSMGTGIGLYMSKMIIERNMNGKLSSCNCDGGADFIISIPLEVESV